MSADLKAVQVRLSEEAYAALAAIAKERGRNLGEVARDLLMDSIYGRARNSTIEVVESSNGGFVYVIRVGDLCKIGKSRNPELRIRGLSLPSKPEVICTLETNDRHASERAMHKRFHQYRKHGEWFHLPPDVIDGLRKAATA